MIKVEVRTRVVGRSSADEQPPSLALELLEETLAVQDLITRTVDEQIHDLLINQKLDADHIRQILARQYLTEADVEADARHGAIKVPSAKSLQNPQLDIESEIRRALHGFERNAYLVVVDGQQQTDLSQLLTLHATSKITFLRLTPLVGG
jgi:hypothetical protein